MEPSRTLLERLSAVQLELKAPKSQRNSFGGYDYRNAEDILEAVKPLLEKHGLVLTLSDELVQMGERYYIKAAAEVRDTAASAQASELAGALVPVGSLTNAYLPLSIGAYGYAREEETKKGMDGSQITGAASSYARKYALNGLFLIDDTKDSDATNDHGKTPQKPVEPRREAPGAQTSLAPVPTISEEQMAELMQLAKRKGYTVKRQAVAFLDRQSQAFGLTFFTHLPASQYEAFKKFVITSGWKDNTNEAEEAASSVLEGK